MSSAATQPLALRKRADLIVRRLEYGGQSCWGVKDPVSLRYFQLQEEEYFILDMLEEETSLEEIQDAFQQRFAPRKLEMQQLHAFLGTLHRDGLILSEAANQGPELLKRGQKQRRREFWGSLANPLAIRFRGVDPERFINWLSPKFGWFFSRWCAIGVGLLAASALVLLAVQWQVLQSRLPGFSTFFSAGNLLWIALALAVVKVLHELGHALACKRFGGECHELGLMLLVFTPCLYCNVSDAWMLRSKWRRAAIGAAGIYVEIFLASVCTWLWWFSQPGLFNTMCLNSMFVCSLGTVLFNGNPLLRYDGYYILADVMDVPNLSQQAAALWKRWFSQLFLGIDRGNPRALPTQRRGWIALYGVASLAYRLMITVLILWFVYRLLAPRGLVVLAQMLALTVLATMFIVPLVRGLRFLFDPLRNRGVKWMRFLLFSGVTAAILAGILLIPLPRRVSAPLVVQPRDARRIYVATPGRLVKATSEGKPVKQGDVLFELENPELSRRVVELISQRNRQRKKLDILDNLRVSDKLASEEIPQAEKVLEDIEKRLAARREETGRLLLRAPRRGIVLPPRRRNDPPPPGELPSWKGTPLDPENLGTHFESGTLLCRIGNPQQLEAITIVDQSEIKLVEVGQRVAVRFDALPGEVFTGKVVEKSETELEEAPPELTSRKLLPSVKGEDGVVRPASTSYQVRVSFDLQGRPLPLLSTGRVKISVDSQSLGSRLYRYLRGTFGFQQ